MPTKLCNYETCQKHASFGLNRYDLQRCPTHATEGMKRCSRLCKCGEARPTYNLPDEKTAICCSNCKSPDMVNVVSKRCKCDEAIPIYNLPGEKTAICCSNCKTADMVNVVSKRCKQEHCDVRAQNPQYEGYCLGCFIYNFPDKPVARNYKTKEAAVAKFIMETFPEMSWVWDVRVMDGCSGRRPDLVCDMGPYVMIVEVDERQHRDYVCACENKRLMLISQDVGHKPIVFIRFNPDTYLTNKGRVSSCWKHNKQSILVVPKEKQRDWSGRLDALKNAVEYWRANDPGKMVEVVEMFYDENWMVAAAAERTTAAGGSACHVEADDE